MEINEYIESGILEAYVLGSASEAEARELLYLKVQFPQLQEILKELESDVECIARSQTMMPPPGTWMKIESGIKELIETPAFDTLALRNPSKQNRNRYERPKNNYFIDVESTSSHMQVHKVWRWVFGAVFLLGKIFLACAIYFYFENRAVVREMEQLKTELKIQRTH